jgi:hypothetical protein
MAPLLDWDVIDSDEREVLAERLAGWTEKHPDVPVRRLVARDRPARALVEESAVRNWWSSGRVASRARRRLGVDQQVGHVPAWGAQRRPAVADA